MSQRMFRILVLVLFAALILPATGCGNYMLRGKIVQGDASGVELIHEMDERLKQPGIANVETLVRRDPNKPNPTMVGRTRTDAAGDFSMAIEEFGAGWMQEEWLVQARQSGFQNASSVLKLPAKGSKWRLLITLAPGTATPLDTHEEIVEDFERFK